MKNAAVQLPDSLADDHIARRIDPSRKHLWLVAPPKSGSTWLGLLLEDALGWKSKCLLPDTERREQELDWRPLLTDTACDLFTHHQHVRASRATLSFIKQCHVRVVILSRSLTDSLVSLRDHLANFKTKTPVTFVDESFRVLDSEAQMDFLIDLALPWYLNFYASWATAKVEENIPLLFLSYEELRADPAGAVHRILEFAEEPRSDVEVDEVIEHVAQQSTRRNHAITGRGNSTLTDAQKQRVHRLRDYYSHLDFTPFRFED
jgi:hypothetical protein